MEEFRTYSPPHGRLPGRLASPEPGSLCNQRQPAGIEPDVVVFLGRVRLVAGCLVRGDFQAHTRQRIALVCLLTT